MFLSVIFSSKAKKNALFPLVDILDEKQGNKIKKMYQMLYYAFNQSLAKIDEELSKKKTV